MTKLSKENLQTIVEIHIMDTGFDWNGKTVINLTGFDAEDEVKICEVVQSLGLGCEPLGSGEDFLITMPKEFIIPHQNLMEMHFAKQGGMTDFEMAVFLDYYISAFRDDFDEFGMLYLDTSRWSIFIPSQIIRVAENMDYECEYLGDINDYNYGIFIIRKYNEEVGE